MLNLAQSIELHEQSRPGHPALLGPGESLTYTDLALRIRQYAAALADSGVQQGDLIGMALRDTVDHVVLLFAVLRLGAVIVPIDWRWTTAEQISLIEHFDVGIVLVDDAETHQNLLDAHSTVNAQHVFIINADWRECARSMPDIPAIAIAADLPAVLSLSSGTTGRPSGPLATHAHFFARLQNQLITLTFNQHDRYLLATPLFFGGGRAFVLTHLIIGATVVMNPPPFTSRELVQAATKHNVNSLFLVPTLIRRLLREPDSVLSQLRSLRVLISSGAPLHADERAEVRRRITAGFFEYYASTEGGGITILSPEDQAHYPDSVGRSAFEVEVQIVDDNHNPVACEEVGRIRYRGPGVARSFYKDREASAKSFRDRWFYPGDLGRMNDDGYLFLLGRSKDMIIRGGVNIYPVEIERVIGACPGIDDVAVVPAPSTEFGEEIVAFIVQRQPIAESVLVQHCREQLASYKVPARFEVLNALPRSSAGKVLKAELVNRLADV